MKNAKNVHFSTHQPLSRRTLLRGTGILLGLALLVLVVLLVIIAIGILSTIQLTEQGSWLRRALWGIAGIQAAGRLRSGLRSERAALTITKA